MTSHGILRSRNSCASANALSCVARDSGLHQKPRPHSGGTWPAPEKRLYRLSAVSMAGPSTLPTILPLGCSEHVGPRDEIVIDAILLRSLYSDQASTSVLQVVRVV